MSTKNQPTIPALRQRFAAYSLAGGALWYTRWLECELCNAITKLGSAEECIFDMKPIYVKTATEELSRIRKEIHSLEGNGVW